MSVLINKKVCDNAKECSCIEECPSKAFYFDQEKNTIAVINNLCTKCRICMIACPAGAVKVARNEEEYQRIKKEYHEDIRTEEELFVDRYGAAPINEDYLFDIELLEELILDSNRPLLVELFKDDETIHCLIQSIPISEIINELNNNATYRKVEVIDNGQLGKYNIKTCPSLLLVENGKVIKTFEGFCHIKEKEKLLEYFKNKMEV